MTVHIGMYNVCKANTEVNKETDRFVPHWRRSEIPHAGGWDWMLCSPAQQKKNRQEDGVLTADPGDLLHPPHARGYGELSKAQHGIKLRMLTGKIPMCLAPNAKDDHRNPCQILFVLQITSLFLSERTKNFMFMFETKNFKITYFGREQMV